MGVLGAFTFVLHSHLPFARLAGRWPHGEEWIHEAACETYIPLLRTLYDLKDARVPFRLTLGITPTLAAQLADPLVLDHLDQYLDERIAAAQQDMVYFSGQNNGHLHYLAQHFHSDYREAKQQLHERFHRDILGAFRQLQDEGLIELIASAATHAYLPLLATDSAVRAQIALGIQAYVRHFGRTPTAFWLPECAYRPAVRAEDGHVLRPGLEAFLAEQGVRLFFSETHTITGGQPVGVAAGEVLGPSSNVKQRYVLPPTPTAPIRQATTYQPYYVADSANPQGVHPGLAVIGRNNSSGQQVWSAEWGYPGDFDYREFHKKAGTSGLRYWRVTGERVALEHKDVYQPNWAAYKVDQHAEHYAHLIGDLLRDYHQSTGRYGIVASTYDAELFGHWWYEGVAWLGKVLRHLSQNPEVHLTTATAFLDEHPPDQVLSLSEGSWGAGGNHFTWDNGETRWMWGPLHEAEARMERLVAAFPAPTDDERVVLAQTARELLLCQSSDWPFLVTTGQAREYAIQRYNQHLERFQRLADSLEAGTPDRAYADELYALDNIFPDVDVRLFAAR